MTWLTRMAHQVDRKPIKLHLELIYQLCHQLDIKLLQRSLAYVDSVSLSDHPTNSVFHFLVFCLPFFVLRRLKLHQTQKIALVGVFSVGLITMTISLSRFLVYTVTDYTIDDASGSMYPHPPSSSIGSRIPLL